MVFESGRLSSRAHLLRGKTIGWSSAGRSPLSNGIYKWATTVERIDWENENELLLLTNKVTNTNLVLPSSTHHPHLPPGPPPPHSTLQSPLDYSLGPDSTHLSLTQRLQIFASTPQSSIFFDSHAHSLASTMSRILSQLFALLAIALFSIPTILAACACAPGYGCVTGLFGATSCSLLPCALGTYAAGGTAACAVCPAGSRFTGANLAGLGATGCTACLPGSFSALPGSPTCALASPGSYVPTTGATAETLCSPGSYQNLIGQTACPLCPCGSYNPLFGQIICLPCGEYDVYLICLVVHVCSPLLLVLAGRFTVPLTGINLIGSSPRGSTFITQCSLCPGGSSTSSDPLADQSLYNPLAVDLVYTNQCCGSCPANAISQPG